MARRSKMGEILAAAEELFREKGYVATTMADIAVKVGMLKRSEEHTSELQSHSFISYAVFCLKKKK